MQPAVRERSAELPRELWKELWKEEQARSAPIPLSTAPTIASWESSERAARSDQPPAAARAALPELAQHIATLELALGLVTELDAPM